jgi:Flp pilus assembly protein TadG
MARQRGARTGRPARQSGQATIEFALLLPIVAALLLLIAQVGLVLRAQVLITHAAREAARAAAVDPAADVGAVAQSRSAMDSLTVTSTSDGSMVTVRVHVDFLIHLPLLSQLHSSVGLDASASMRSES